MVMTKTRSTAPGKPDEIIILTPEEEVKILARQQERNAQEAETQYRRDRKMAYNAEFGDSWQETLDYIYHNGLDVYLQKKSEIKAQYPKGSQ